MARRQKVSGNPVQALKPHSIRLPPELLGKIYLENALPQYPADKGSRYPPMAISKSWRNAALSHPQLWVHINITQYSDLQKSSPDTLQSWLSRSKPCFLELMMHFSRYRDDCEMDYGDLKPKDAHLFQSIMKVLFAHTHRWGSLDVCADDWQLSHIFQVLERAIQLREITLQDYIHPERTDVMEFLYEPWATSDFDVPNITLPSVTSLLFSLRSLPISAFPSLELPNLTELAFEQFEIEFEDLVEMMKRMPSLSLLRLEHETGISCTRLPADVADISSGLGSLVVWDWETSYTFLPHLAQYCPKLRDITLHYMHCVDLPASRMESLTKITLILVNECNLGNFSNNEARNALMLGPNARELTLEWEADCPRSTVSFDPFINALACEGDSQGGVLLKLEHLKLQKAVLRISSLLNMLQVRSGDKFETSRNRGSFYLTLEGCYALPNISGGTLTEVKQLLADPPEVNMTFSSWDDPYAV